MIKELLADNMINLYLHTVYSSLSLSPQFGGLGMVMYIQLYEQMTKLGLYNAPSIFSIMLTG